MPELVGWVPTRSGALWSGLTLPDGPPSGRAVVLVPPFGWEGMAAARQLRAWARDLGALGHAVLRYHPPGEGDSEGSAHDQDLTTWTPALVDLVEHLRRETGASGVTAVGLGLGGLVALHAVSDACPLDELVLWTTPGKGRAVVRELRAFAALVGDPGAPEEGQAPVPVQDTTDESGALWVHGYPLSAAAQEQLAALDAEQLSLRGVRRALLLGRGTLPPDRRLVQALEAAGAAVTAADGPGYDVLTGEPRLSRAPEQAQATVASWLATTTSAPAPRGPEGTWTRVEPGERAAEAGLVRAVVTPAQGASLTVVLLGAGATPRSGPNRLWTQAAHRWRDQRIASLRPDVEGVGEADGSDGWETGSEGFYDAAYAGQVAAALGLVAEHGLPAPLVLVGLCSGGYWAAQTALTHPDVRALVLLNAGHLVWPPPLAALGPRGRVAHLTSADTWRPLLTDPQARRDAVGRVRQSLRLLSDRVRGEPEAGAARPPATTLQVLRALHARGVAVTIAASPGEPALDDLHDLPVDLGVVVHRLQGPVGAHTLATQGLVAQATRVLDEAVLAARSADEVAQR